MMPMNARSWRLTGLLAMLLVLAAVPVLFLWSFQSVVRSEPTRAFDQKLAQKVIGAVADGVLKADASGRAALPSSYTSSSFANRVYPTHSHGGLTMILFPTSESWDGYVDGCLHCSRTLTPADFAGREPSTGNQTIAIAYRGKRVVAELQQQFDAHWYVVHHDEFTGEYVPR